MLDFQEYHWQVHVQVLLLKPTSPVCREDCAGPEPDRFPAMAHVEPVEDAPAPRDERWAALDDLTFDD